MLLVHPLERNRVEFDLQPRFPRCSEPFENLRQRITASEPGERLAVQRVERDVDAAHSRGEELIRKLGQARTVGGERQLLRSEEHTSELQSLMRISYAVFCLKKKNTQKNRIQPAKQYR